MNRLLLQRQHSISQIRESITDGNPQYSPTVTSRIMMPYNHQFKMSVSQIRESITDGNPQYSPTIPRRFEMPNLHQLRMPVIPDLLMDISNEPVVGLLHPITNVPVIGKFVILI